MNYYEVYKDRNGEWRWRYIAANGRIIGDSAEGYVNKSDCVAGIGLMKASSSAPIRER
jgi:uncharacterized protein YegP (UPF0339 family)